MKNAHTRHRHRSVLSKNNNAEKQCSYWDSYIIFIYIMCYALSVYGYRLSNSIIILFNQNETLKCV